MPQPRLEPPPLRLESRWLKLKPCQCRESFPRLRLERSQCRLESPQLRFELPQFKYETFQFKSLSPPCQVTRKSVQVPNFLRVTLRAPTVEHLNRRKPSTRSGAALFSRPETPGYGQHYYQLYYTEEVIFLANQDKWTNFEIEKIETV